jgi:hypothetical protein
MPRGSSPLWSDPPSDDGNGEEFRAFRKSLTSLTTTGRNKVEGVECARIGAQPNLASAGVIDMSPRNAEDGSDPRKGKSR